MPEEPRPENDTATDRALEERILQLLDERGEGKTICPSDAARSVYGEAQGGSPDDGWRDLMEPVRRASRRLVAEGQVVVTQGGEVVDPETATGPIRLRRVR